jgi:hypothetical protein
VQHVDLLLRREKHRNGEPDGHCIINNTRQHNPYKGIISLAVVERERERVCVCVVCV